MTEELQDFHTFFSQVLGKYCDSDFVGSATREMQEDLDMTPEEMNLAAHQILTNANVLSDITSIRSTDVSTSPTYAPIHLPTTSGANNSNFTNTALSSPSTTFSSPNSPTQRSTPMGNNLYRKSTNNYSS